MAKKWIIFIFFILSCSSAPLGYQARETYWIADGCLSSTSELSVLDSSINEAFTRGFECLNKLQPIGKTPIYKELTDMMNFWGQVAIDCPKDMDLKYLGQGSSNAKHYENRFRPHIWLNLKLIESKKDKRVLSQTVFHELLHQPGYNHETTIDYAWACEFHCFPSLPDAGYEKYTQEAQQSAKEICSGKYDNPDDIEYLRKIINLLTIYGPQFEHAVRKIHAAILRNLKQDIYKFLFGKYMLNSYAWMMGSEFMLSLEKRHQLKDLSSKEREWIVSNHDLIKSEPVHKDFIELSRKLSQAYLHFYDREFSESRKKLDLIHMPTKRRKVPQIDFDNAIKDYQFLVKFLNEELIKHHGH